MLTELRISNFAIIQEQMVQFGPGLNVISGQTGSGKSIVLNALELILGARPRSQFIRTGADHLEVEGRFELSDISEDIMKSLPDVAQTEELVLFRSINQAGKGKVYINGRMGTVSLLQEISQKLINICGQGQHISLLDPAYHLKLVDQYAGTSELLAEYQKAYTEYKELNKAFSQIESGRLEAERRRRQLNDEIEELSAAKLYPGMRESLELKTKKLEGAEKLILGVQQVITALSADDGAGEQAAKISSMLAELVRIDPDLKKYSDEAVSVRAQLEELEKDLNRYLNRINLDDQQLATLRNDLAEVARLERKYRMEDSALVQLLEDNKRELDKLNIGLDPKGLIQKLESSKRTAEKLASKLRDKRESAGTALTDAVEKDLTSLNMPDAKLKLEMEECELGPGGADKIEILISSNKGEMFKSLKQIASGGELSRIMLVLKKNLRDRSGVNVLVFDEVDSGISGSVARAVGEKLKTLSQDSQVICITHLAQIASLSDRHLLVDKQVKDRAISVIRQINGEEKIDEIARMLAGYEITSASRESARELLTSKS